MKRWLVTFPLDHPRWVIALVVLVTVAFAAAIPRIVIDTDPKNMLPENEHVRVYHDEVNETYGLYDMIVVGIVHEDGVFNPGTLSRVHDLTEYIRDLDGVIADDLLAPGDVDDIFTNAEGILRVETLMETPPESDADAARVLVRIDANPILRGKLASADGRAIAIFVPLERKDRSAEIAAHIQDFVNQWTSDEEIHIAGIPLAEDTFGAEMFKQMAVSAPLAFGIIFLLMWYFFRNARVVLAPMLVALMAVIWTMGLLIATGNTVHIMSSMIPIFLIPIAVLNSIHMLTEFHERYPLHRDMRRTIIETMDELFIPMLFTSLTTVVGFASLMLTPIPPVQVFGAFVAFGIAASWFLSVTFNIAYASLLPERVLVNFGASDDAHGWLAVSVRKVQAFSLRFRRAIPIVGALVFAISLVGLTRIVVNDNPVNWFKADHPLRIADVVMNEHLAGTYMAYLDVQVVDGTMTDPEIMSYLESLQAHLALHPNVGATTSVADVVKKVEAEFTGTAVTELPDSQEAIAQYLFLYEMSGGNPEDLFHFITPEYDRAVLWVQMHEGENRAVNSVVEHATLWLAEHPSDAVTTEWSGLPYINVVWQNKMVAGMGKALAGSFGTVLLMMIVLFRSVRLGLLSMVPLTATIALVYGFIGFVGKPYDMPIAVLSSLTLGLSIDFAIHFLQRTREYYRETGSFESAMDRIFDAPARAIARNILVIAIGFVPMFFANLAPYVTVGAFFFAIMVVSGVTTLVSLPAMLSWIDPRGLLGRRDAPIQDTPEPITARS